EPALAAFPHHGCHGVERLEGRDLVPQAPAGRVHHEAVAGDGREVAPPAGKVRGRCRLTRGLGLLSTRDSRLVTRVPRPATRQDHLAPAQLDLLAESALE